MWDFFGTTTSQFLSQVTCGDHVKWITDEKSRKDRSMSKGQTMSLERDRDLKRRVRNIYIYIYVYTYKYMYITMCK